MNEEIFKTFPVIESHRLWLRNMRPGDADRFFQMRSNRRVMKFLDHDPMKKEEAAVMLDNIIRGFHERDMVYWALALKSSDAFIGGAGFWRLIKSNDRAEIGFQLIPEYWRQGYTLEALNKIIRFGLHEMGLHSIEAHVNPSNKGSIRLLEKLGFVREAYFRESIYFHNRYLDNAVYSLIKSKRRRKKR